MKSLTIYLIFTGNCREALEYYKECLGGEIVHLKTFKESPLKVSAEQEELIFDSELVAENITLKASDSLPENTIKKGSNFSLFVTFDTVEELQKVYTKLAKEGQILMALPESEDSPKFSMVIDKYNIQWMLTMSS